MKKKAQITFFVIIGIIILIAVFLTYSFIGPFLEKKFDREQEKTTDAQLKMKKYTTFIDSCLEQTTTDALVLLGKQGGTLYSSTDIPNLPTLSHFTESPYSSKSPLIYYDKIDGQEYNVAYSITAPELTYLDHLPVPQYPYGIIKLTKNPSLKNAFGNYPGVSPLPFLCDFNDKKNSLTKLGCGSQTNSYDLPLKLNLEKDDSIQEQLEIYISAKVKNCLKIEDLAKNFPELQKEGITIADDLMVNISIKEDAVEALLTMKLTSNNKNTDSSFIINKNTVSVPIRLKQIHALLSNLVKNDINNIFFDIVQDASSEEMLLCDSLNANGIIIKTQCLKPNMKVYKLNNVGALNNNKFDDFLIIEDKNKLINGKPYIFQIAIENRIPAVDLIKDLSIFNNNGELGKYVDLIIQLPSDAGYDLTNLVKAYDPDEDFHENGIMSKKSYEYYISDGYELTIIPPINIDGIINNIGSNPNYQIQATTTQLPNGIISPNIIANFYNIQVKVCDDAGECDYQIVKTLIIAPE